MCLSVDISFYFRRVAISSVRNRILPHPAIFPHRNAGVGHAEYMNMSLKIPLPNRPDDSAVPLIHGSSAVARPFSRARSVPSRRMSLSNNLDSHVVVVRSGSGGVGVSVFCALLALSLAQTQKQVGLIDASLRTGGLEVMLGLEEAEGLRWSGVMAPMGRLDPQAFVSELMHWEGVDVLSADPWNLMDLQKWEIEAAYRAVIAAERWTVVDAPGESDIDGCLPPCDGDVSADNAGCTGKVSCCAIVLVELSVLGLVRAKAVIRALKNPISETAESYGNRGVPVLENRSHSQKPDDVVVIGVPAHLSCSKAKMLVSKEEAAVYLDTDILGVLAGDARLEKDISAGLGVRGVPRKYQALLASVIERLEKRSPAEEDPPR